MPIIKDEWYIIVNPHAGSGKTMYKWIPAEKYLKKIGVPFYTVFTTHKHHAAELAATAARIGYRRIMAVGGDGSLHEVFNGVLSWCESTGTDPLEFYLAVFPIGSGNDWIKSFGVDNDLETVCDLVKDRSFTKSDVIRIEGDNVISYMANVGGMGFDSHVCMRVNEQKEHGKRSERIYLASLLYTIFHLKPFQARVIADGKTILDGKCLSIALGNGRYSGGGMKQCCLADTSDGLLDAMIVPRLGLGRIFIELPRILKGTINESKWVKYVQCRNLDIIPINGEKADWFEADGEVEGRGPLHVGVTAFKINVLCGRKSR